MKKVINKKLYDTATAKELGSWWNSYAVNDFHSAHETLYRKRTGEFFLHGEGGPASIYAKQIEQNVWSGGEKIIPLTVEAAREWAEEKLDADEYEAIFGTPDDANEPLTLVIPAALAATVRDKAAKENVSATDYLLNMIGALK